MDQQLRAWKLGLDRFWSAAAPDYREATRLVAEIAGSGADMTLRKAAAQALPSLRNAMLRGADQMTKNVARRSLGRVGEVLHELTAPRFGRRGVGAAALTPEQRNRQMLGLPFGRRLSAPEIHAAYKRVAKSAHPDGGGSAAEFLKLAAARDALMKER